MELHKGEWGVGAWEKACINTCVVVGVVAVDGVKDQSSAWSCVWVGVLEEETILAWSKGGGSHLRGPRVEAGQDGHAAKARDLLAVDVARCRQTANHHCCVALCRGTLGFL